MNSFRWSCCATENVLIKFAILLLLLYTFIIFRFLILTICIRICTIVYVEDILLIKKYRCVISYWWYVSTWSNGIAVCINRFDDILLSIWIFCQIKILWLVAVDKLKMCSIDVGLAIPRLICIIPFLFLFLSSLRIYDWFLWHLMRLNTSVSFARSMM